MNKSDKVGNSIRWFMDNMYIPLGSHCIAMVSL